MLKHRSLLLAGALGLAMAVPGTARDITADTVVVTVGDTDITIGHMIALSLGLSAEQQQLPPDVFFREVLDLLIQQEAVSQTKSRLSRKGELRLENSHRALLAGEAANELSEEITVSEDEIRNAYEARYANYVPQKEFNASHILVKSEEEAMDVLAELEDGADFAELAKERSTGPSGANGGNLGWFGSGQMVAAFENAVMAMNRGQVSGPVRTQFGWHVITLNDVRDSPAPTLDEIRQELQQELWERKFTDAIQAVVDSVQKETRDLSDIDPAILQDTSLIDG